MKKFLTFLFPTILLTSCSPQFGGGGWMIPIGLGLASLWTFLRYFGAVKSPNKDLKLTHEKKGQVGTLVYAIVWAVAACVIAAVMGADL